MTFRRALYWSLFWIGLSLTTALAIWIFDTHEHSLAFLAGYTIEKALSVDNLFVFLMLFSYFRISPELQRRVLNWGVIGVALLRGIMIFAGVSLVSRFEWLMYIFGAVVIYTGIVMIFKKDEAFDPAKSRIIRAVRRVFPISDDFHGNKFFIRIGGILTATPLFLALAVVELTDVLFAFDSIPAVLSVSRSPLVVYGSNMLAVLGLRSLYFLLERTQSAFRYVKHGVGVILWFVGVKMLSPFFWSDFHLGIGVSLGVIVGILAISVLLSVLHRSPPEEV